jgi:hypothetical protein
VATETKVTFDGVKIKEAQYKTFEYTNTLINKSLPTGFCQQMGEETQKTTYGTELDGIG